MNKVRNILTFLLVLLLPSQLAFHWWPEWSLVNGIRVDYLSPTLYFSDLLLVSLALLSIKPLFGAVLAKAKFLLPLVIFIGVNIYFSKLPFLALYNWIRILEIVWLVWFSFTSKHFLSIFKKVFPVTILWTGALSCWQLLIQHSVGGFWYWLGERSFTVNTPGIAKVFVSGVGMVLRPYATLPHPNALAGFILMGLIVLWILKIRNTTVNKIVFLVGIFSLVITFSRTALLSAVVVGIVILLIKRRTKQILLFTPLLLLPLLVPGNPNSYAERYWLNASSIQLILSNPAIGAGLGNFIPANNDQNLPVPKMQSVLFQPVHNIYLLMATEIGIIPTLFVLLGIGKLLYQLLKRRQWNLVLGVGLVLFIGLVDHYWLTLNQPRLLLSIFAGVVGVKLVTNESSKHIL